MKLCANPLELTGAVMSIVTFVADVATDLLVAVFYFYHGHLNWGGLTLGLILIPGWIVSFFSWSWQREDSNVKMTPTAIIVHLFIVAPLWRYYHTVRALLNQESGPVGSYSESLRDVSMLRLIEGVCESTPQLILQLYIILKGSRQTDLVAIVSSFFSLISVSWGVASYTRALRKAYDIEMTRAAVFVNFTWRCYEFVSRVVTLVMLAYCHGLWVLAPIGIRWVLATSWITCHGTRFHHYSAATAETLYRFIMGFLNVFMFFNTRDGPSKYHAFFHYTITAIELLMVLLFTHERITVDFGSVLIWISVVSYCAAILMMLIYYSIFHPKKTSNQTEEEEEDTTTTTMVDTTTIKIVEDYQPLPRFVHLEKPN